MQKCLKIAKLFNYRHSQQNAGMIGNDSNKQSVNSMISSAYAILTKRKTTTDKYDYVNFCCNLTIVGIVVIRSQ